jgi:transporter family protein
MAAPMDWKLLALGSAFFAGTTALLGKIGVRGIPSNLATLIRTLSILPFMIAVVVARGEWSAWRTLSAHTVLFLVLSGVATGISWMCYYRALQLGPASLISPIDKLSMVVAIFLSIIFLGERLTPGQWTGVILMIAGAYLVARA